MAKRILVVSQRCWPEKVKVNEICEGLVDRGYYVDVICGQPNYPLGQFYKGYSFFGNKIETYGNLRLYRTVERKRGSGTSFGIMMNYIVFSLASKFKAFSLRKNKYDAVLVFQTSPVMACAAALEIGKKQNIPVVTIAVDVWPQSLYNELDMQSIVLRKVFRSISENYYVMSDRVIALNKRAFDYFTKELHIHAGRVKCIPLGPDAYALSEVRDYHIMERFAGSFNIVIVDRLIKPQDLDTIAAAAAKLNNAGIRDLRFIVVGMDNKDENIKKKISKLGLNDMVFLERIKDVDAAAKYFYVANAFLCCEKTGNGDNYDEPDDVINYMANGKPIIFAGDGEGRRIVKAAKCGFTADPEDAESLFSSILSLYKTPAQDIIKMSRNAKEYQEKNYNTKDIIDKLLEVMYIDNGKSDDDYYLINSNTTIINAEKIIDE